MELSRKQFIKSFVAGIAGIKAIASGKVEAVEKEEVFDHLKLPANITKINKCKNCYHIKTSIECQHCKEYIIDWSKYRASKLSLPIIAIGLVTIEHGKSKKEYSGIGMYEYDGKNRVMIFWDKPLEK